MPKHYYALAQDRLNKDIVEYSSKEITIVENQDNGSGIGAGVVRFSVSTPCIRVRVPRNPIRWLKHQKCADSIVLEFSTDGVHLHLIELKSTINANDWLEAKQQFSGAYINALAMRSILGIEYFASINLHIAFSRDRITHLGSSAPSTLKVGIGTKIKNNVSDWINREVQLDCVPDPIPLKLIVRDNDGNADCTLGLSVESEIALT